MTRDREINDAFKRGLVQSSGSSSRGRLSCGYPGAKDDVSASVTSSARPCPFDLDLLRVQEGDAKIFAMSGNGFTQAKRILFDARFGGALGLDRGPPRAAPGDEPTTRCVRCRKETDATIMSMLNADSRYEEARRAEGEAPCAERGPLCASGLT